MYSGMLGFAYGFPVLYRNLFERYDEFRQFLIQEEGYVSDFVTLMGMLLLFIPALALVSFTSMASGWNGYFLAVGFNFLKKTVKFVYLWILGQLNNEPGSSR